MADKIFSDAQKKVIGQSTDNILVSAAAGSGKTTVLVERIISRIRSGELSIDNILVVTFTNDAAINMQKKIEEALKAEIDRSDSDRKLVLTTQQDKLPNAYIQTFDSFCTRVVTEKGYVLIDKGDNCYEPGFAILDEGELKLLRKRAASLAIEDAYLKEVPEDDSKTDLMFLTERFGDGRSDASLEDSLVATYEKLRCLADYRTKIQDSCVSYGNTKIEDRLRPPLEMIIRGLKKCADNLDDLRDIIGTGSKTYLVKKGKLKDDELTSLSVGVLDRIQKDIFGVYDMLMSGGTTKDLIEALKAIETSDVALNNMDKEYSEACPFCAICRAYGVSGAKDRGGAYALSEGIYEIFKILKDNPIEDLDKMACDSARAVRSYTELLLDMDKKYSELKYSARGMDFADQEYAAFDIFTVDEACDYYRNKFSEIYVDEYQDNTDLQDEIIKKISRGGKNVFRVGDVKQSIYRFRNSDPLIFTGMLSDMEADGSFGTPLYLNENYRSSPEVLNFINFIFLQLMDSSVCGIDYPRQMLNFPRSRKEGSEDRHEHKIPEILIADVSYNAKDGEEDDPDAEEGEETSASDDKGSSSAVSDDEVLDAGSRDVKSLDLGVEYLIREYMKADPGHKLSDICVLTETRSMAYAVTEHLEDKEIAAAGINITTIFTDNDIHRLASLIICLGNSYRDEYMLGVLLAPFDFSNFTLDEIAHINAFLIKAGVGIRISLIDRFRIYADRADPVSEGDIYARCVRFLDTFDDLRSFAMTSGIASVAEEVFKKTHIKATVDKQRGNHVKIDLFKSWLVANFKRFGTDISGIANEFEQMKIKLSDKASVETRDSQPDKVTVMNVHKSKGLEYKYVILVVKPRKRMSDNSVSGLFFDGNTGWHSDWYDQNDLCRRSSVEMITLNEDIFIDDNSELMRLLYVALTRAEDRLSVVMCADPSGGKINKMYESVSSNAAMMMSPQLNSRETMLRAKTGGIFYFLLLALMRTPYWNEAVADRFAEAGLVCDPAVMTDKDTFKGLLEDYVPFEVVIPTREELLNMPAEALTLPSAGTPAYPGTEEDDGKTDLLRDGIPEYKYKRETEIPFKVSVTSASSGTFTKTAHVDMNIKSKENYGSGRKFLSSAAKGTILHALMRAAQPEDITGNYEGAVDSLIEEGFFAGTDPDKVREVCEEFKEGVTAFYKSDIGRRLEKADSAGKAGYEYPLVFSVYTDPSDPGRGSVLIQGIADLVFEEEQGLVLLDYKTDKMPDMDAEEREQEARDRHSLQIDSYAAAFAKSGKTVFEKWIYLVRYSQFVRIL